MYISFFGLRCKPFELVPDPGFLMLSKAHKRALIHLNYGIAEHAGFILVTGEVGTGKTTVIRKMMKGLGSDIKLARINNTRVTSEQLISMISEDFGLQVKGKSKTEMLSDLSDFLIGEYARGGKSMLIIDEAQNLSADLLEEIRLLSNLETDKAKLLQIILVGQPELLKVLARPELRQLRQRISISCQLQPITREETEAYILHRLEIAGNRQAVRFQEGSIDAIHKFSRGIPRLINIACDFLMLSAYAEETKEISLHFVKEVIGEIENSHGYWHDVSVQEHHEPLIDRDTLQSLLSRLELLEASRHKAEISRAEREDLLARLAEVEKRLDSVLALLSKGNDGETERDRHDPALSREIEVLRKRMAAFEKKLSIKESPELKRKNLWTRIFN